MFSKTLQDSRGTVGQNIEHICPNIENYTQSKVEYLQTIHLRDLCTCPDLPLTEGQTEVHFKMLANFKAKQWPNVVDAGSS